jgi:hypothetical protein
MATRITRIDDIDGTDGAEVFTLELDRKTYEIDLGPRNRARLLRVIRPYIERARALDSDENQTKVIGGSLNTESETPDPVPEATATTELESIEQV